MPVAAEPDCVFALRDVVKRLRAGAARGFEQLIDGAFEVVDARISRAQHFGSRADFGDKIFQAHRSNSLS
jgi:hypothetical protein